jgi:WD40 repeat protein
MGVVYLARQTSLGRLVALKMILADPWTTEVHRQRFRAETETIARLQHPNIVQIYEVGETDARAFCALEYVDGGNLAEKLDGKPCTPQEAAELLATVAEAVQAAHARGILHRDLKPANILLACSHDKGAGMDKIHPSHPSHWGVPKLTDFGLAKQLEGAGGLTETGVVIGTPSYMSPEQAAGHNSSLGPPADVYALGAILYEMLTGRPPLVGPTPLETLTQVLERDPVPPRQLQPRVPRDLETICLKCLQKDPARRFGSARELADDLRRFLRGEAIHARPVGTIERLVRWCERRPAVAMLTAAVFGLLVVVGAVSTIGYLQTSRALIREENQRREAERLQGVAEKESTAARAAEKQAQQERATAVAAGKKLREASNAAIRNRRSLYPYKMLIAQQWLESESGQAARVATSLAAWNPTEDEEDLRDFAWRYLWGLVNGNAVVLRGHGRSDKREGLRGALGGTWLADDTLVTTDGNRILRRWDSTTGKLLAQTPLLLPEDGDVRISLAASGGIGAVLSKQGKLRLIDLKTGKTIRELNVPGGRARDLHLSPDGKYLVVRRGDNGTAWQWQTATSKRADFPKLRKNPEQSSALAPDGVTLAFRTGEWLTQAALLDLRTMVPKDPLRTNGTLYSLAFSRDGKQLAGGNIFGSIFLASVEVNSVTDRIPLHSVAVNALAFSPDGKALASGDREGVIAWTDIENGEFGKSDDKGTLFLEGHTDAIQFVAFSHDGKKLLSGSRDGTARVWDLGRKSEPPRLQEGTARIMDLACSADGSRIAATQANMVRVWDARTGKFLQQLPRPGSRAGWPPARALAFAPDGKRLAVGDVNGAIHLWNLEIGMHLATLEDAAGLPPIKARRGVAALTFSPDGKLLVCGHGMLSGSAVDYKQVARVWDVETNKILRTFAHGNSIYAARFSHDGRLLVTGCADGQIRTWDTRTWTPGRTIKTVEKVNSQRIRCMALSPDDSLVAAGRLDGAIHVWELRSGKQLFEVSEHGRTVAAVAFTPDGKTLVSGGQNQALRLWHVLSGRAELVLRGHDANVSGLVVTPDGNTIASADGQGNILLWRAPRLDQIEKSEKQGD